MTTADLFAADGRAVGRGGAAFRTAATAVLAASSAGVLAAALAPGARVRAAFVAAALAFAAALAGAFDTKRRAARAARLASLAHGVERRALLRRVGELTDFVGALRVLDAAADDRELHVRAVAETLRLVAADYAWIVLRNGDGATRLGAASDGANEGELSPAEAAAFAAWFEQGALPTLLVGAPAQRDAFGEDSRTVGASCVVAAPLGPEREAWGALVAARAHGEPFDAGALQALGLLADAVGRTVQLRSSERRLKREHRRVSVVMQRLSRAQSRLVRGERSRAVGELVSGVAHELNNPLAAVSGYAQLLQRGRDASPAKREEWLSELARETERCAGILRNLLGFARRAADSAPVSAPLRDVVRDALDLAGYELRSAGVRVEVEMPDDLPIPDLDRSVLQHILLNLVGNATEALREARERRLTIRARPGPEGVELEVSDSGSGVAAALRERIFDPFFTTRGGGCGLGLTTCRALLERHGGKISLRPAAGPGATFALTLPLRARARSAAGAHPPDLIPV